MAAQDLSVDVIETGLWPQGDGRDPLGIWGARLGVTGTDIGGIKVRFTVPADKAGAYVYTCYSLTAVQLTGALLGEGRMKSRLLTSWPNVDPVAGVQAFGTMHVQTYNSSTNFTAPTTGPLDGPLLQPNDRFLLLFDPRPGAGEGTIAEIEFGENGLASTYSFEAYGYFWDRSVMNFPGGPRHPGSS